MSIDPLDEIHRFKVNMAVENVKFYEGMVKSSTWRRRDAMWLVWFPSFAVIEFGIMIWDLVDQDWWSAGISFIVGCSQIWLYFLNKRTKQRKMSNHAEWVQNLADAHKALEELDPTNSLVPLVIEEEP